MENCWPLEKAAKYLTGVSRLIVLSGIFTMILSVDGFVILGKRGSAFLFPYVFDIISFIIAVFQIYLGVVFSACRQWMKVVIFILIGIHFFMGYIDPMEVPAALILLLYVVYVLNPRHAGWLFKEKSQS